MTSIKTNTHNCSLRSPCSIQIVVGLSPQNSLLSHFFVFVLNIYPNWSLTKKTLLMNGSQNWNKKNVCHDSCKYAVTYVLKSTHRFLAHVTCLSCNICRSPYLVKVLNSILYIYIYILVNIPNYCNKNSWQWNFF